MSTALDNTELEAQLKENNTPHALGSPELHLNQSGLDETSTDVKLETPDHYEIHGAEAVETGIGGLAISQMSSTATNRRRKDQLARPAIPLTTSIDGIVGWESQEDPEMPLNFPPTKKWFLVGLVASMTLLSPFASSILSPGIGLMNEDFGNNSNIVGDMTVSIYLLGYVIGCALAPSIGALVIFRFLCGIGGAGCLTLGGGIIGDMFHIEERGLATGIWALGPIFGPTLGPLAGGFIAASIGWRWDFWVVLILGACVTILLAIFNTETNHKILIERKIFRLEKELGRQDLKSCYPTTGYKSTRQLLARSVLSPITMLFRSPMVLCLPLYIAFVYGVMYLLFTTIPVVFRDTYGFSVGTSVLVYLALGFGNFLGWGVVVGYSDQSMVRLTRANNGQCDPEFRLSTATFFGSLLPATFFWYGWCTYYQTHWISPILSLISFGAGSIGVFLPITTYLVDCYPTNASTAIAASTVFRSLAGAFLPLAGQQMYNALGLGWGNSLLGFICIGMIPLPLVFSKHGTRIRQGRYFDTRAKESSRVSHSN